MRARRDVGARRSGPPRRCTPSKRSSAPTVVGEHAVVALLLEERADHLRRRMRSGGRSRWRARSRPAPWWAGGSGALSSRTTPLVYSERATALGRELDPDPQRRRSRVKRARVGATRTVTASGLCEPRDGATSIVRRTGVKLSRRRRPRRGIAATASRRATPPTPHAHASRPHPQLGGMAEHRRRRRRPVLEAEPLEVPGGEQLLEVVRLRALGWASAAGGGEPTTVPTPTPTPPVSTGVEPLHAVAITCGGRRQRRRLEARLGRASRTRAAMLLAYRSRGVSGAQPVAVADHLQDRLEAVDRVVDVSRGARTGRRRRPGS